MHRHIRHQAVSFRQAVQGVAWAFYTQPHFQFHLFVGILVLVLAFVFRITTTEIALLLIVIFGVLIMELVNTAIEAVVNLATSEWEGYAKVAKDVAAGAVLMMSLVAAIIGAIIFVPRILLMLGSI